MHPGTRRLLDIMERLLTDIIFVELGHILCDRRGLPKLLDGSILPSRACPDPLDCPTQGLNEVRTRSRRVASAKGTVIAVLRNRHVAALLCIRGSGINKRESVIIGAATADRLSLTP